MNFSTKDIEVTRNIVEEKFGGIVFEDAVGMLISILAKKVSYTPTRANVVRVLAILGYGLTSKKDDQL